MYNLSNNTRPLGSPDRQNFKWWIGAASNNHPKWFDPYLGVVVHSGPGVNAFSAITAHKCTNGAIAMLHCPTAPWSESGSVRVTLVAKYWSKVIQGPAEDLRGPKVVIVWVIVCFDGNKLDGMLWKRWMLRSFFLLMSEFLSILKLCVFLLLLNSKLLRKVTSIFQSNKSGPLLAKKLLR